MEKIDRLGWAAGISFVAYGRRIGIRANVPDVLEHLAGVLPFGWRPASSPVVDHLYSFYVGGAGPRAAVRRFNLVYAGSARLARTLDLDQAFRILDTNLHLYVAESARRRLFMHAGVVGWRGRAIVIPGRTFTGKTSLVAALLRAGATYYSDELAVFDAQGRVHPFPEPLSIRDPSGQPRERRSAADYGSRPGEDPLPVGLVVVTRYTAGARWRPRPLSPGRAVLMLLAHTPAARWRPRFALATLPRVVSQARVLAGRRGEAEALAPALLAGCGW